MSNHLATIRDRHDVLDVITWADGFGTWHCRIVGTDATTGATARAAASEALEFEINQRHQDDHLHGLELVGFDITATGGTSDHFAETRDEIQ